MMTEVVRKAIGSRSDTEQQSLLSDLLEQAKGGEG